MYYNDASSLKDKLSSLRDEGVVYSSSSGVRAIALGVIIMSIPIILRAISNFLVTLQTLQSSALFYEGIHIFYNKFLLSIIVYLTLVCLIQLILTKGFFYITFDRNKFTEKEHLINYLFSLFMLGIFLYYSVAKLYNQIVIGSLNATLQDWMQTLHSIFFVLSCILILKGFIQIFSGKYLFNSKLFQRL